MFVLGIAVAGHAIIPAAGPCHAISLPVETVSLFPVHTLHQRTGIGVLCVAGIEITLAAVTGLKLQGLHRGKLPAQLTVNIFVHHPFTSGGIRTGVGTGTFRFMPGVNILCIGLGFTQITPEIEADTVRQRTIEAKVSTFRRPFFTVLRSIHIGIPRPVPFSRGRFGHDVDDPAHRAITIARRRRAADHIDMIDHLRWHPTGIAAGVTIAAPAIPHRVTAGHRFTIDQHQRILGPHATDINLPVVAALPAGRVAGQVYPGLRTN